MFESDSWYLFSIVATLSYGVFNFLQKAAAEKGVDSASLIRVSAATVLLCSVGSILAAGTSVVQLHVALGLALLNSSLFFTAAMLKLESLKRAASYIVFPITKTNAVVAVLLGLVVFAETPSHWQWLGVGLTLAALLTLTTAKNKREDKPNRNAGIIFALIAAICTGVTAIIGKLAALHTSRLIYMGISYLLVFSYSFKFAKTDPKKGARRHVVTYGIMIGALNFVGYLALLTAYKSGDVSVIQPIFSTSITIPIVLSVIVFKERMAPRQLVGVLLSLLSVVLLKLG